MDDSRDTVQEKGAFRAILHPYRSLEPKGFVVLMTALGLVSFIAGIAFLSMGAWPVFGFFGLDVLLVYVAFKLNYRSGRAYEIVELTPKLLKVTRVDPRGKRVSFDFNPYWAQVELAKRPDGGTRLSVGSHGQRIEFGRFLTEAERRDFARALSGALAAARAAGA